LASKGEWATVCTGFDFDAGLEGGEEEDEEEEEEEDFLEEEEEEEEEVFGDASRLRCAAGDVFGDSGGG